MNEWSSSSVILYGTKKNREAGLALLIFSPWSWLLRLLRMRGRPDRTDDEDRDERQRDD